jgi:acyl-CoA synthetase (AMP-forming)/AMP-acid ligase II
VIAVQLPNTIDFVLTVLAAHRAGLVIAPFLLWQHAEPSPSTAPPPAPSTTGRIDGVHP